MSVFAVGFLLLLPFAATLDCQCSEESIAELEPYVFFALHTCTGEVIQEPASNTSRIMKTMNPALPTTLYIHGWRGNTAQSLDAAKCITTAYCARRSSNVLQLIWYETSSKDYVTAVLSIPAIACIATRALLLILNSIGSNWDCVHIMGHSLGAHMAGNMGNASRGAVSRCTGLDPAGPGFDGINIGTPHLKSGDCKNVTEYHTNAASLGSAGSNGDADFWINYANLGVQNQPGCGVDSICSHFRAVYYMCESVYDETAFKGRSCESGSRFKDGSCNSNATEYAGYGASTKAKGKYFLTTNAESLYGRGDAGAKSQSPALLTSLINLFASFG